MKNKNQTTNKVIRGEERASKHINILSQYDDSTLLDKSGKLIKIIKLDGLDSFTKDEETLDAYKRRRNNLLKSFSSEFAFYIWEVRRKANHSFDCDFPMGYANEVNDKYMRKIKNSDMYRNDIYLAVITKHPEGLINKGFTLISHLNHAVDKQAKQEYLIKRHKELCSVTQNVMSSFSNYGCKLLTVYEKNNIKFSPQLAFLSQLINFDSFNVPLVIENVASVIPRKRLFFTGRAGTIEMRSSDGSKKFSAMLSIKAYSPMTYQGILDELSNLRCEYVITQSFRFYDRPMAKAHLRDQQKEMMQTSEESISQTDQIDDAFDGAASGEVGYGLHHFTLACYADSLEELNQQVSNIVARFADIDITCVREDVACESAFWAQLPGNFRYILRPATISTKNMAAFASLHNSPLGRMGGNHWGDAVTILETKSGSPYYFNFHYKDVGNFLIFGSMGSGKTLLVGFLITQSMKFGGKRIIFDKDRGLEILVRALGGTYERIKPGLSTGFNPCLLPDSADNRQFLSFLFKRMLTVNDEILSDQDNELIETAISGLYRLAPKERQFCHIASFFGAKKTGSLRNRFDQWHSNGAHSWLFDNATDTLNLDADVLGFDLGSILAHKDCKTPALMYLTYRIEKAIEGNRGILFCDEGWALLSDDYFKTIINEWSRTPRKKDNIFGLATQVANDTINASTSKSIVEAANCKVFFANSSADRDIHINHLGLSEYEYHIVKTLADDQHYFLLVHGRSTNKQSVVVRANFADLEDVIPVISARESTLALLDQIRNEVGDDPKDWLPIFKMRCKEGAK
ncbi:MAG: VirB4 family type IV secretion/conjugal transfer ATPase [Gammaproteobacteria bacterium]